VKTGVQYFRNTLKSLDSGFHRNDDSWAFSTFYEVVSFEYGVKRKDPEMPYFLFTQLG